MAKGIVESALTMNPIEVQDLQSFIVQQIFTRPELMKLHGIRTGVKMKEQIVLASQFGKTGIKGNSTCTRKTSGASSTLTQKYWEPAGIEDTLIHCNASVDSLFKAYFGKINEYRQKYDIQGTDLEIFLSILFLESMSATVYRAVWFGDTAVAAAGAGAAGLVDAANVKFYDYFNGLWKQIFAAVTATKLQRVTITENATVTSKPNQLALAAGKSVTYFDSIKAVADSRLRSNPNAKMYVSREIFDNYTKYLTEKGVAYDVNILQNGLPSVKWDSYEVVNMETIWGLDAREDFVNNTTNNVYNLPHRILFTVPENILIGTLNENDLTAIDMWFDKKDREFYMEYGFSLDAKLIEEYMAVTAY